MDAFQLRPVTQDDVAKFYGRETADKCADYFTALALPLPLVRETLHTSDDGYLLFLNRYGLTIRLIDDKINPPIDDPLVLQPIASRKVGRLRADIYPGVYPEVSKFDSVRLSLKLLLNGVRYWDEKPKNGGYLPKADGTGPGKDAVVLDAGACYKLYSAVRAVASLLRFAVHPMRQDDARPQDELYKPLRDSFNAAWPADSAEPDAQKMTAFWDLCREKKEQGHLVAEWHRARTSFLWLHSDEEFIPEMAQEYEERLQKQEQTYGPVPFTGLEI